ncbi:glycosyltransferase family 4 protein [Celeribacter halophilus]|uniref:glycosyltransferase family 4 protein n=1 Tax=Celeribacter halophilus TaxID=576117 RepID=UPI003A8C89CD
MADHLPQIPPLAINARFLEGSMTAVNRVALELSKALVCHARAQGVPNAIQLIGYPALEAVMIETGLPYITIGKRTGILWEQLELPHALQGRTLVGFHNTAPVMGGNHITMLHDAQVFDQPESYPLPTRLWRQFLSRRAGAAGRKILTVSEFSKSRLIAWKIAPEDRIDVIYNGVGHLKSCKPEPKILTQLVLEKRSYFVGLASLQPHKNIKILLEAFHAPELKDMRLVLTGAGTKEDFEAAGYPVPSNVIFSGFVSDGALRSLYESAIAVCTPSLTEGFGLPPLEGMTLGTPAVVAPCGALPEVCQDGALYAAPDKPEEWVENLTRLASDEVLRAELSTKGRAISKGFSWSTAAKTILKILDK